MPNKSGPPRPNSLLRRARQARSWSQEQLAEVLSTNAFTVSRWERGYAVPRPYFRQKLCALFGLAPEALGLVPRRTATPPRPALWSVPYPRNPLFIGREAHLRRLEAQLHADHTAAVTQAISGLGGIGKTQLALEYTYRFRGQYQAIFWVRADTRETLVADLGAMAQLLDLPERQEANQDRLVAAVKRWLEAQAQWLLVVDNIEDLSLVWAVLPTTGQGHLLLTTRLQATRPVAEPLVLGELSLEEGARFLLTRIGVLARQEPLEAAPDTLREPAQAITAALGGLPLALDQAGAYIEETGCSSADFLQRYEQQRAQLLDRRGVFTGDHPLSVTATFRLAIQGLERTHPAAVELLQVCAFLHAEAIPEELFVEGGFHLGPVLASLTANSAAFDLTMAALRAFSLVQRRAETRTFSLHRLVQAVLQEQMSRPEHALRHQRVVRLLNACFPEVTYETWTFCERLLPHVLACATGMPDQACDQELAPVLRKTADYLRERGQYAQAEPLYQQALHIQQQRAGSDQPQVASSLDGLARLYSTQRRYEQAELLYQQALHIREQTLGPEHPDVASSLNGLAILYYRRGALEQAEPLYQRALRIWEQTLGPEHVNLGHPLNNLAILASVQGRFAEAERFYQRAVHIWEQALGPEHPNVSYPLNNLANLYKKQGRYTEAEPLYQRAVHIWEQALGPEHPLVAGSLHDWASLYKEQGRYAEAGLLYQRALHIREQRLGSQHPETVETLQDFAALRRAQGNQEEAERLYQRALASNEQG